METNTIQPPRITAPILILLYLILAMVATLMYKLPIEITLASILIVSALLAMDNGHSWKDVEKFIVQGCKLAIIPILILMTIGALIASWIMGGVVPYLVYLGLTFLSPEIFLPSTLVICIITSMATGSSWTTIGTIGIALTGVGASLGIPLPPIVGCIVSGSFFGDKMSPLSDSTNLAAAVGEANLFDHIKHMLWTTLPALIVSLILYTIISLSQDVQAINSVEIDRTLEILQKNFHLGWWCLIPPLFVVVMAFKKVDALATLFIAVIMGALFAIFIEGTSIQQAIYILNKGFVFQVDESTLMNSANAVDLCAYSTSDPIIEKVNALLTRGGLQSMMRIIAIAFLALGLGGIMEQTRMLEALIKNASKYLTSAKTLIPATLFTSWLAAMTLGSQYMAMIIPGRMFLPLYHKLKIENINLSRTLEDGGTMIAALLPWSFSGIFVSSTLGVAVIKYAPYTFLNIFVPVFTIICAVTGIGVTYCQSEDECGVHYE